MSNGGRKLAPHVQAAIARGAQAKVADPGGPKVAAHVQAAIARGAQAKVADPGGAKVATHVPATISRGAQAKVVANRGECQLPSFGTFSPPMERRTIRGYQITTTRTDCGLWSSSSQGSERAITKVKLHDHELSHTVQLMRSPAYVGLEAYKRTIVELGEDTVQALMNVSALLIYVHGTYANNTDVEDEFIEDLKIAYNVETSFIFKWSGGATEDARQTGAKKLTQYVRAFRFMRPNLRIVAVGHSHGGNVIGLAVQMLKDESIQAVTLLGTPQFRGYGSPWTARTQQLIPGGIYNVYDEGDKVQTTYAAVRNKINITSNAPENNIGRKMIASTHSTNVNITGLRSKIRGATTLGTDEHSRLHTSEIYQRVREKLK